MSELVIREARPEDDAVVGDILVSAYVTQYAQKLPHVVYSEQRKRDLRATAAKRAIATVLVAERAGRVVGTVTLFPPGAPGSEAWVPGAADLRHLATDPALHGQGLGRPLLDAAEAHARARGWRTVCLHVRQGVTGVARMYAARGYRRAPEGDLHYPEVDLEAYVKEL